MTYRYVEYLSTEWSDLVAQGWTQRSGIIRVAGQHLVCMVRA